MATLFLIEKNNDASGKPFSFYRGNRSSCVACANASG
jgi:hypothetical protein